jgi:hypothetical protein
MRALAFFPLAYVAGVHGFALFAPYAATFLVIAHFLRRSRQAREARLVPITQKTIVQESHESLLTPD